MLVHSNGFRIASVAEPDVRVFADGMELNATAEPPLVMHTVTEAAGMAGISPRYMHMRIAAGTGPEVTRIGRRVFIRDDWRATQADTTHSPLKLHCRPAR